MSDQFQVKYQGKLIATATWPELCQQAIRGELTPLHKISPDGVRWRYASEFPQLFGVTVEGSVAKESKGKPTAPPTGQPVEFFLAVGREKQGPFPQQAILAQLAAKKIGLDDLIWRDGFAEWLPLRQVFPNLAREEANRLQREEARKKKEEARKRRALIQPEQRSYSSYAIASFILPPFWGCCAVLLLLARLPSMIFLILIGIVSAVALILGLAGLYDIYASDGYRKGTPFAILGILMGLLLGCILIGVLAIISGAPPPTAP